MSEWCELHPAEAARLMGYEVVEEEKEDNMDKQKPLKDWTLEEVKSFCAKRTKELGNNSCTCETCQMNRLCAIDVGQWDLADPPRFTEEEVADARVIVRLEHPAWNTLVRKKDGTLWLNYGEGGWHALRSERFPSIKPGQSCKLSEITGGDV